MCLWLITACLGVLPANPAPPNVIVVGLPTPILQPTPAPTTAAAPTTTTAKPAGNTSAAPPPVTNPPSTTAPPLTTTAPPPPPPATTVPPPPATTQPPQPVTTPPPPPVTTAAPTTNSPVTATPPPATAASTPSPATTNPAPTASGGPNIILICNDPTQVCVANPDQPITAGISIDPRQGTPPPSAPPPSAQPPMMPAKAPPMMPSAPPPMMPATAPPMPPSSLPIVAYSGQDSAVKFPRQRRSVRLLMRGANISTRAGGRRWRRQAGCTCVPTGSCPNNNGAGQIDFRIVTPGNSGPCPQGQVYCCYSAAPAPAPATVACGTRQPVPATAAAGPGQADFGEYPWMAIILTSSNDYVAGGVLIDQYNVLTVIHRISSYIVAGTTPNLKIRLGEWDASGTYEPIPFKEYTIRRVFQHPSYNSATLQFDIAVLRLSTPVPFTPAAGSVASINRACLPSSSAMSFTGQRCWVTGWGKNAFNQGLYQQILKEVDVPVVDSNTCQSQLQAARLGPSFVLDTSTFICAGGEMNKDSCTGDGGSGLVCQVNGQWVVAGLVAWGLGCAATSVPGVYISVPALLPWIQQQQNTPA